MLVTSKELLLKAQEGGYAVGAFNVENMVENDTSCFDA